MTLFKKKNQTNKKPSAFHVFMLGNSVFLRIFLKMLSYSCGSDLLLVWLYFQVFKQSVAVWTECCIIIAFFFCFILLFSLLKILKDKN